MIELPLFQTTRWGPDKCAYVEPSQIESLHDEDRRSATAVPAYQRVCLVTMKNGEKYTTTKSSAQVRAMVADAVMPTPQISKVEIARLLPGDVLVVTMRDGIYLSEQEKDWHRQAWCRVLPAWVTVVVVQGADVKVVRADGWAETEADRDEEVGRQSGQTFAECG